MYVKCGKCKACLQEKANKRTARIRNHEQTTGRVCLFITLTYDNRFIPYIRPSELSNSLFYNIYRDNGVRYKRKGHHYATVPCRIDCEPISSMIELRTSEQKELFSSSWNNMLDYLPNLRKLNFKTRQYEYLEDKVGICYYKDFQDFYKRFEIIFKREYGYRPSRSYAVCSEYGETYCRPHFHMLLFCQYDEIAKIKGCIFKAWPFTGNNRKRLDIQIARNAASYVSQYINCGIDFPTFLRLWFKPKFVTSQSFGHDNIYYHLDSIVSMFQKNDWSYPCTRMLDGQTFVQNVPLPRYVLSSWFPQIKGYARLYPNVLFKVADCPQHLGRYAEAAHLGDDEIHQYGVRLRNARERYIQYWLGRCGDEDDTEYGRSDYAYQYANIWNSYLSFLQRWTYENYDISDGWQNFYENIGDVLDTHRIRSDVADLPLPNCKVERHPDNQPWNVRQSQKMSELFDKKKKQAKVSNLALVTSGFDV